MGSAARQLILPAATLLLGLLGGMAIAGGIAVAHYEKVLASNQADQAVVFADTAAEIDAASPGKAREIARDRLRLLIGSIAMTMKPAQAQEHAVYLEKISTYVDTSPGMNLSDEGKRFLAAFPPLKGKELQAKRCDFGVCRLAKEKAEANRLNP